MANLNFERSSFFGVEVTRKEGSCHARPCHAVEAWILLAMQVTDMLIAAV